MEKEKEKVGKIKLIKTDRLPLGLKICTPDNIIYEGVGNISDVVDLLRSHS